MDPSRLRSIPLFAQVSDEEVRQIAPFAEEVSVVSGRELVREGDFSYEFFVIEEGSAEVRGGGEHIADLGPGDYFGEMGLLEKELRMASVIARSDMRLITLTGWDLKRMQSTMPEVVDRIRETLEQRRPPEGA